MNYFDSSALLKLLFEEPETVRLKEWLSRHPASTGVTSQLGKTEVIRATRRLDPLILPAARRLIASLDLTPTTADLADAATEVGGDMLRSLDAIHLASAMALGSDLTTMVAYDARLIAAARAVDLPVVHPGAA